MSYLREAHLDGTFAPFVAFQTLFGFVPNVFRAQTLLPRVIEAEAGIASAEIVPGGTRFISNPESNDFAGSLSRLWKRILGHRIPSIVAFSRNTRRYARSDRRRLPPG